jgi:hypothetical protein
MIKHILAYFGYYKADDLTWRNLEQWTLWILSYELTKAQGDFLIASIKSRVGGP